MSGEGDVEELHDGVPPWLSPSLIAWVHERFRKTVNRRYQWNGPAMLAAQRSLQLDFPYTTDVDMVAKWFTDRMIADEAFLLRLIDHLLGRMNYESPDMDRAADLNRFLIEGGSLFQVEVLSESEERAGYHLARRVHDSTREAARLAIGQGRAGVHLGDAWRATFGREPNPTYAYREAIRAIEAAAKPVIEPANEMATLGTMIKALKAKPRKWHVILQHADPDAQVLAIATMCEVLWKGEFVRHGTDDPDVPYHVTQHEAEATVVAAVALVHWFTSQVVVRL